MTGRQSQRSSKKDCRFALRSETAEIHEQLHRVASFQGLLDGNMSLEHYVALMTRLHGFYVPLDRSVLAACSRTDVFQGQFCYQPRAEMLAQDLATLGVSPGQVESNETCVDINSIETAEALAGVIYVIEGSVLGGAMISKAINHLPLSENVKRKNYWTWCRINGKARWAMTLQFVDELDCQGVDRALMVDAAKATFAAMHKWLARPSFASLQRQVRS